MGLISCDTFVCLPPNTGQEIIIFGKNSDRPEGEVQEIIYQPRNIRSRKPEAEGSSNLLKCTYIDIEEADETYAVILSKPSWMWGAEMGANEFGVVIGNEAVWTKLNDSQEDLKKRLLGMDLLRLGLERGQSAREALGVITNLIEKYGQGGPCSDTMKDWSYHNSFLIADAKEAWVLETAGNKHWAAEKVTSGFRNISNGLSIGTKIDAYSPKLKEEALELGFWDGKDPFHFARAFSDDFDSNERCGRYPEGRKLLKKHSETKDFNIKSMMAILRDERSGICMGYEDSFPSTSSQVSVLTNAENGRNCHWFTGTPDPGHSVFKPFFFHKDDGKVDLVDTKPKFTGRINSESISETHKTGGSRRKKVDRRHELYKLHETFYWKLSSLGKTDRKKVLENQRGLEDRLIDIVEKARVAGNSDVECVDKNEGCGFEDKMEKLLFNQAVDDEIDFYKRNIGITVPAGSAPTK